MSERQLCHINADNFEGEMSSLPGAQCIQDAPGELTSKDESVGLSPGPKHCPGRRGGQVDFRFKCQRQTC